MPQTFGLEFVLALMSSPSNTLGPGAYYLKSPLARTVKLIWGGRPFKAPENQSSPCCFRRAIHPHYSVFIRARREEVQGGRSAILSWVLLHLSRYLSPNGRSCPKYTKPSARQAEGLTWINALEVCSLESGTVCMFATPVHNSRKGRPKTFELSPSLKAPLTWNYVYPMVGSAHPPSSPSGPDLSFDDLYLPGDLWIEIAVDLDPLDAIALLR